jgi:glycosyltransferase involved in cell wall biosynthesis
MNRPLVSLLMLGYQSVQFVKYAIDSVKAQSYTNWELVFVDDCSTDGTYELVSKLAESDTRIKVYRNEKNLGIVKNRKRAYELSTGDLICHFDNDDMLERWALEEMVYEFARLPEVMLIYTDLAQIDSDSNIELYSASKNYDVNQLHQHGWKHLGMYRREVMKHIEGYNDKLISACEDGDLFMQIAEKFPISRYPKVLYYYRNHGKNNVHNNKKCPTCEERMVCNFIRVWCKSAKYDIVTHKPLKVVA